MPKKRIRLAKSSASPKTKPRTRKAALRDTAGPIADSLRRLVDRLQDLQSKLRTQDDAFRQVQADLALLRDRHTLLHDLSPVGHLILDADGRVVEATSRAGILLGRDLESLIGQPLDQLVARDYHDTIRQHCRTVIASGTRQTCEAPIQEDTDVNRWIHFESLVIHAGPSPITRWRTAVLDVSDRKRAEEVLRFARFSLDRAADAVYWIDPQANILDVNDTACRMLGYTKEALCSMTVHDLNPEFQADRWPGFWEETKRRGTMVLDTVHVAKDGQRIPVEVSVNFLSYEGKDYHCAFVRDMTERKKTEQSLKLFRTLLDQATDAIEVLDPETGRFLDCNERACSNLGYTRDEFLALSVPDIDPLVPFPVFRQKIQQCREVPSGQAIAVETMHRRKDGSTFPVEVSPRIIQLDREYCLAIVRDITERKNAEAMIKESEEHFRTLIEHSSDIVTVLGTDGVIQFQSPSIERLLGYGQAELKGRTA
ncbi:MAG: PAS domain S-box protein, partial [Nitrospira sp.]|nr:PAS domain S-box protein [Nitrospira sp.]